MMAIETSTELEITNSTPLIDVKLGTVAIPPDLVRILAHLSRLLASRQSLCATFQAHYDVLHFMPPV